jgi:hypothetical protein
MMEGPWRRFRREARAREQHRHRCRYSLKTLDQTGRLEKEASQECATAVRQRSTNLVDAE